MDWEKAYHILEDYIILDEDNVDEFEHRINMCNPVYRILHGATDETIKKAQERLRKETGYGERHGQPKEIERKRTKTTKLSKRYTERSISQSA